MDEKYARYLLEKTKKDYEKIAQDFSLSRQEVWEEMRNFAKYTKPGYKVLDAGCGNGRMYTLLRNKDIKYLGLDSSKPLIQIATETFKKEIEAEKAKFEVGDVLDLPYNDEEFDLVYSIAVLHQIPSTKFRIQALREAKRVLKKDSYLIITVWGLFQKAYIKYVLRYNFLKATTFFCLASRMCKLCQWDWNDTFIPWKGEARSWLGKPVLRYYHAFTARELRTLLKEVGFKIKDIFYIREGKRCSWRKGANLCVIAKKVS